MLLKFIILTNILIIELCPCKTTNGKKAFKKGEGRIGLLAAHTPYKVKPPERTLSNRIFHPVPSMTLGGF